MIEITLQRVLVCVLAAAVAGAAVWAGVGRGTDRGGERPRAVSDHIAAQVPGGWDSDTLNDHRDAYRNVDALADDASGAALLASLSPELVAMARETTWDSYSTGMLVRFMECTFDHDSDGTLGDDERIIAVRTLRDAVWPDAFADAIDEVTEASDEVSGATVAIELSPRDRRLYHDIDEARRRDHQESGGASSVDAALDPERRDEVMRIYQIKPDGLLSVSELARFMARYNAGSAVADLDGDGAINESDLRLFLNVASPIKDSEDAK